MSEMHSHLCSGSICSMAEPDDASVSREADQSLLPAWHAGSRRRAAYLYGLIICGTVLAAEPENITPWVVGAALVATMLVYWTAETFAHWVGARSAHARALTRSERWELITDGLPLVAAGLVPAVILILEGVAGIATPTAVTGALVVTTALLAVVGWMMSPTERPWSVRRIAYASTTVLLGLAMIELKNAVHH